MCRQFRYLRLTDKLKYRWYKYQIFHPVSHTNEKQTIFDNYRALCQTIKLKRKQNSHIFIGLFCRFLAFLFSIDAKQHKFIFSIASSSIRSKPRSVTGTFRDFPCGSGDASAAQTLQGVLADVWARLSLHHPVVLSCYVTLSNVKRQRKNSNLVDVFRLSEKKLKTRVSPAFSCRFVPVICPRLGSCSPAGPPVSPELSALL